MKLIIDIPEMLKNAIDIPDARLDMEDLVIMADSIHNGTVQPAGEWQQDRDGTFLCSVCGSGYSEQPTIMGNPMFDFCPICGADMRGLKNEVNN